MAAIRHAASLAGNRRERRLLQSRIDRIAQLTAAVE
jgi:hypothetical protein